MNYFYRIEKKSCNHSTEVYVNLFFRRTKKFIEKQTLLTPYKNETI